MCVCVCEVFKQLKIWSEGLVSHRALHFAISTNSQWKPKFPCEEICSFVSLVLFYVISTSYLAKGCKFSFVDQCFFFLKLTAMKVSVLFIINTILLLFEFYSTFLLFSVDPTIWDATYQKLSNCPGDEYPNRRLWSWITSKHPTLSS